MSEEQQNVELSAYKNYNVEAGIILSGMLVADATGEKVIVKVAGEDHIAVVAKLEATIEALVATGNYERLSDRQNRKDEERQQSASDTSKSKWGTTSTDESPQDEDPMAADDGSFQVKQITFLKTRKGDLKCVVSGTEDGEAIWLDDKFIQNYRDGNYAQYFPQHNQSGGEIDVFANEKFKLDNGDKNVLYDINEDAPALVCHWRKNKKGYTEIVRVEMMD